MDIDISNGIRNARKSIGLTQEQMAEVLGVTKETLSNYENNKTIPDIITVCKIAMACKCSVDSILFYDNIRNVKSASPVDVITQFRELNEFDLLKANSATILLDSRKRYDEFYIEKMNLIKEFR